jgi:hypothetical protein
VSGSKASGTRFTPPNAYPAWARLPYTLFVAVLVPVYWGAYGPGHFLWFSDIALFALLISLWTGNRLLYSMMAVGVLPVELLLTFDFLTGAPLGVTGYMFDPDIPLHLRGLSLFHLMLPPLTIWMLIRQGYDRRALPAQTALAWLVLPASFLLTDPQDNINWVHGVGDPPEQILPPAVHLGFAMVAVPAVVYVPMHFLLRRLFPEAPPAHR